MAKKMKAGGIALLMLLSAVLIVGLVFGINYVLKQSALGGDGTTDPLQCPESTGILTVNAVNALNQGSAVTATYSCSIGGGVNSTAVTSGTTTFPVGSEVECLASASDYIDDTFSFVMSCGGKTISVPLYYSTSDNPSIRAKNDEGDYMADTSGAVVHSGTNQTAVSAG